MTMPWRSVYPQFNAIRDESWPGAIEEAKLVALPAGLQVYQTGDRCRNFVLVLEGVIRIYATGKTGREIVIYRVNPGEFCILTLVSLLQGHNFPANAITETPVRTLLMDKCQFESVYRKSNTFRDIMIDELSARFLESIARLQEIAFDPLDVRMANLLYARFRAVNMQPIVITHSQLAQELGTTREVASRILKDMEQRHLIQLARGSIRLHDEQSLARLEHMSQQ